jgi:hypothetical protein
LLSSSDFCTFNSVEVLQTPSQRGRFECAGFYHRERNLNNFFPLSFAALNSSPKGGAKNKIPVGLLLADNLFNSLFKLNSGESHISSAADADNTYVAAAALTSELL